MQRPHALDEVRVRLRGRWGALGGLGRCGARGRLGGATIVEAGLDQRVGELVRALAGRDEMLDCTGRESGVACPFAGDCRLRGALHRAREAFFAELDTVRVRDLVTAGPAGGTVLLGLPELPVPR